MMPAYPRYRDSGIEWLGDVPKHWGARPLKSVLVRNDSGVWGEDPTHEDEGDLVLRSTEQAVDGRWQIEEPARRRLSVRERKGALLARGDLVITKSSGSESHIGKASLVTGEVAAMMPCFSNFMQRLRFTESYEPRLAWYLLNSPAGRQQLVFHSNTTTGLANLNGTILGAVVTPLPPLDEQRAIADYLDRETARVDALIDKKRLLLERLDEQRTALISEAVTRGLPPDAARAAGLDPAPRLTPSGVEWLGDVPEHWEVRRVKTLFTEVDRRSSTGEETLLSLRMRVGLVPDNEVSSATIPSTALIGYKQVNPGELVMNRMRAAIGIFGIASQSGLVSPDYAVFVSLAHVCAEYYLRLFKTPLAGSVFRVESLGLGTGSAGFMRLHTDRFGALWLPYPPLDEQYAIAAHLDRETARIDTLITTVTKAIDRLTEYRTALITAAVTGQIDVTEASS